MFSPVRPRTIAEGLRDQAIAVDGAYEGFDAAVTINVYPYDVVVLDRDPPGLHGDDLCRIATEREQPPMILARDRRSEGS